VTIRGRGVCALAGLLAVPLLLVGCGSGTPSPIRVEVTMHYSSYAPAEIRVPAGRPVEIVLLNRDPIDHEWIVGDADVHQRHRTGTEPVHDARPNEVSVPALGKRTTTVTFAGPGRLTFVCHLPGHEAYGMVGTITVTA